MSQSIFTFAVSDTDKDNITRVTRLKKLCAKSGLSFTHLVLSALKDYEEKTYGEKTYATDRK